MGGDSEALCKLSFCLQPIPTITSPRVWPPSYSGCLSQRSQCSEEPWKVNHVAGSQHPPLHGAVVLVLSEDGKHVIRYLSSYKKLEINAVSSLSSGSMFYVYQATLALPGEVLSPCALNCAYLRPEQ